MKKLLCVLLTLALLLSLTALAVDLGEQGQNITTDEYGNTYVDGRSADPSAEPSASESVEPSATPVPVETAPPSAEPSASPSAAPVEEGPLPSAWTEDQEVVLADPAPWTLEELKQVADVTDPRSVAAYWVWAVNRLVVNYDDGMAMMKYLFADVEVMGRGYYEGGLSGRAGWETYFNERLSDPEWNWLPRAYFVGTSAQNGFTPPRPLTVHLIYNKADTESANATTYAQLGRLNVCFRVKSTAGGNLVGLTLSRFENSDRWYVTNGGVSSTPLFYDQRSALTAAQLSAAKAGSLDGSTAAEHEAHYGGSEPQPTTPADPDPTAEPEPTAEHKVITITRTEIPASGTSYANVQVVELDGVKGFLPVYALKDSKGWDTNYIRLRDLAALLNGTAGQFDITWSAGTGISCTSKHPYDHPNGTEGKVPFSGDQPYVSYLSNTYVDGVAQPLTAFQITYENGGHTYYQLRDLGKALGFNVGWTAERGMFIETDKPYTNAD